MMRVLGIDVDDAVLERWREWFAPPVQPFIVDEGLRAQLGRPPTMPRPSMEVCDTFELYGEDTFGRLVGLTRSDFDALPHALRARLVRHQHSAGRRLVPALRGMPSGRHTRLRPDSDGHRFVWWPDTVSAFGDGPVLDFVGRESLASRHGEVGAAVWRRAAAVLPGARDLAGTFAAGSGPNCFGTVMAAAGVVGAQDDWMQRAPFEEWLGSSTAPGGHDLSPGTVLVWRDPSGVAHHAAVTLGAGWALHKPSQGWMTPRVVLSVDEVKRAARRQGTRVTRRHIA